VSRTVILRFSISLRGRSVSFVSATKRASVRVSFMRLLRGTLGGLAAGREYTGDGVRAGSRRDARGR
jgi:hypothetical protein